MVNAMKLAASWKRIAGKILPLLLLTSIPIIMDQQVNKYTYIIIESPYWKDPFKKNKGRCQVAQITPKQKFPPNDPSRCWSTSKAKPRQPISSPMPLCIRKKMRNPIPKTGENHFSGNLAPIKLTAAMILRAQTMKGVRNAIRYKIEENRHWNDRLNNHRSPSLFSVIRVEIIADIEGIAAPYTKSTPPRWRGFMGNGMSNNCSTPYNAQIWP